MDRQSLLQAIDHPAVNAAIFFPRPAPPGPAPSGSEDLAIEVENGVRLHARYHPSPDLSQPTVLHFHGNGEIVADYDDVAPKLHALGATLVSIDYRGYGRSGGTPSARGLVEDAHAVLDHVIAFLKARGHTGALVVMGRSLGSAPAIELASTRGEDLAGVIIESGFAQTEPLLALFGLSLESLGIEPDSGLDNEHKMAKVDIPLLVLHAQEDVLLPPWNAQRLHARAASDQKRLVMIGNADHNTIMAYGGREYWGAIAQFLQALPR